MIVLHHLAFSRSIRVLWALEELGVDYKLVSYERTAAFRAPPELAEIHPLGKSPVIVEGDLVLAESSAILRYINTRHGDGRLAPPAGTDAYALHDEWLDYVESSAALPLLTLFRATVQKNYEAIAEAKKPVNKALAYIGNGIGDGPWLMGEALSLADIQMSYMLAIAEALGMLRDHPRVADYLARMRAHPTFIKATALGGPMMPPKLPG